MIAEESKTVLVQGGESHRLRRCQGLWRWRGQERNELQDEDRRVEVVAKLIST